MSGDFSRNSLNLEKRFSLVRLQQGRLLSDADFNEQGDLLRGSHRGAVKAIIGPTGFPQDDAGFALSASDPLSGIVVSDGRAFIGGRELHCVGAEQIAIQRKSGSGTDTKWIVTEGPALAVGDVLSKNAAGDTTIFRVTASELNADGEAQFEVEPSLTPQTLTEIWRLTALDPERDDLPETAGRYLAYLEAWDADVTALDDPDLLEVAFDGPDTSTRDATRWQIRFATEDSLVDAGFGTAPLDCADVAGAFDPFGERATLAARATVSDDEGGPCTLPPDAGYRSVENHLYRVQFHVPRGGGAALYKWGRDNGMHRARYATIEDGALLVDSLGRDPVTALKAGDWIEITEDAALAKGQVGFFAQIDEANGQRITLAELRSADDLSELSVGGEPNLNALPQAATIQRWEGGLPRALPASGSWEELELGIEVRFEDGARLSGDHWTIPARSLTGDVEWPQHEITGEPLDLPPEGLDRAFAPLGFATLSPVGDWTIESDCRPFFAPLTQQVMFDYVSGDGQEAMPDETNPTNLIALAQPLKVSVTRGKMPVASVRIRFDVSLGQGLFPNGNPTIIVETDADGVAEVEWSIDGAAPLQVARAIRIDASDDPVGTHVEFAASLSRARDTSFDPTNTPELAGALNVQDAIELLAQIQNGGCETHVITPSTDWAAVLASIPAGSDVNICFAPGQYQTDETVLLEKLGNVRINGSGRGAKLIANKSECALEVNGCASLAVRGVTCTSPALPTAITNKPQGLTRRGALTVTGTPDVDIADCHFTCGPGSRDIRTALTVRARPDENPQTPMRSVRIVNCSVDVGFQQEGILVHDAIDTVIADNRISVLPIPDGFTTQASKLSKTRLVQLNNTLIASLKSGDAVLGKDIREVRAGGRSFTFMSAIPQSEWDRAVRKFPPPQDAANRDNAMIDYWESLKKAVIEQPAVLPSFRSALGRSSNGNPGLIDSDARRKMLVLTELGVSKRTDKLTGSRNVLLESGDQSVSFKSPVSNTEWQRIFARAQETQPIRAGDDLAKYTVKLGTRLLTGEIARTNFNAFNKWFNSNTRQRDTMALQAIVCAGSRLDNVRVSDNVIRGFNTAIRVALSHRRESFTVRDAAIENNICELTTPGKGIRWLHGIYVGNVDRLLVRNNRLLHLRVESHHSSPFEYGVWVYGFLGKQLLFKDNLIEIADRGFRVKKLTGASPMSIGDKLDYHWLMADNRLTDGVRLDTTNPFGIMEYRDNHGARPQDS